MDHLFALLERSCKRTPDQIVHLGAGSAAVLDAYADRRPSRLVLVEGDPELGPELLQAGQGISGVEVLAHAVASQAGSISWGRWSLTQLNGPVDVAELKAFYPRLREVERVSVKAVGLVELLADLLSVAGTDTFSRLLLLDLPGQELGLLRAVPDSVLHAFDHVVIRSCRLPLEVNASEPEAAENELIERGYQSVAADHESEPLWPVRLLSLDRQVLAMRELAESLHSTQASMAQTVRLLEAKTLEAEDAGTAVTQLTQAKLAAEKLSGERATQIEQLSKARDDQAKLATDCQAQLQALTQARTEADKLATHCRGKIDALTKEKAAAEAIRDEQTKLAAERAAKLAALEQAKAAADKLAAERAIQIEQLGKARDDQAKLAIDRQAQIQALTLARTEADKLAVDRLGKIDVLTKEKAAAETGCDEQIKLAAERAASFAALEQAKAAADRLAAERATQIEQLGKARDDQAKLATDRQAQLQVQTLARAEADKLAADRQGRVDTLTKEKTATETVRDEQAKVAAERAAKLTALEQAKAAADKLAAERAMQIEQLSKARDDQAKLATDRQAQLQAQTLARAEADKLAADRQVKIDVLTKDKTAALAARDEQTRLLRDARLRITQLEGEVADVSGRYGVLQEELIKLEAQIEFVADLLLRGPRP